MAYRLIILKAAVENISDTYNHYEELQLGLGDRFMTVLWERFTEISKHPQYYGFRHEKHIIRDVMLKSFPYLVVYEVEEDNVIIHSIHFGYRHPDKRFKK